LLAIVRADEDVADFHGGEALGLKVGQGVHVSKRFGHLAAIDEEVCDVEPVRGEITTAGAEALSYFVLMVREHEIDATRMHVEGITKVFRDHCGALEVPAGAALAPWGFPEIFAVSFAASLPEHEVRNTIFLVFIGVGACVLGFPEIELAFVEVGEFSVILEGSDFEIHRAILGGVGVAFFDQRFDHRHLLRDVLDGGWLDVRRQAGKRLAVGMKFVAPEIGEVFECFSCGLGIAYGLVIDVGEVADVEGAGAACFQSPSEHVLQHEGAEVSNMCWAIHRGSAAIETIRPAIDWRDFLLGAGESVLELHETWWLCRWEIRRAAWREFERGAGCFTIKMQIPGILDIWVKRSSSNKVACLTSDGDAQRL